MQIIFIMAFCWLRSCFRRKHTFVAHLVKIEEPNKGGCKQETEKRTIFCQRKGLRVQLIKLTNKRQVPMLTIRAIESRDLIPSENKNNKGEIIHTSQDNKTQVKHAKVQGILGKKLLKWVANEDQLSAALHAPTTKRTSQTKIHFLVNRPFLGLTLSTFCYSIGNCGDITFNPHAGREFVKLI